MSWLTCGTYEYNDQKVKNAVYGARHNQDVISTNAVPRLREIPETVNWGARFRKHAVLSMSDFYVTIGKSSQR